METGILDLAVATSEEGMARLCLFLAGSKEAPDIYTDAKDLNGAHLDSAFETADAAAAAAPEDWKLRMDAAFAYAVARDYKYACASSPLFHLGHGAQSILRGLYGQATSTVDMTV